MGDRMFEPGAPLSPSGRVVMAPNGRSAIVTKRIRGRCTWCDKPVEKPRTLWCSDECVEERWSRIPSVIRDRVLARDAGKPCALCGVERFVREVDHTIPIIEGGHPFDLANLRTICDVCHKAETRALAARRAEARRLAREEQQPSLFDLPSGWERLSPPGRKIDATWRHGSGWLVQHCGHPTANTPYQVRDPAAPGRLIVSRTGRGFRSAKEARDAVDKVLAGEFVVVEGPASLRIGRVWRIVSQSEADALARARVELDGPARSPFGSEVRDG